MGRSRHQRLSDALAQHWGERVAERRRSLEWSQSMLAAATKVTQQTISAIEAGELVPLDHLKVRLAFALGTTPEDLFLWPDIKTLRSAAA